MSAAAEAISSREEAREHARNILITGASSGIGAALACVYARAENNLILWGRHEVRLEETIRSCAEAAEVEKDIFDLSDIEMCMQKLAALDARRPLDIAIFNAGLGGSLTKEAVTQSPSATRHMIDVNLTVPLVSANLIAERMAARGKGHIVFVGSVAGAFPLPMAPAYAATKAGLALFAEALRLKLEPRGVSVTLVVPGFIDTPMSQSLREPRPFLISAEKAARIIARAIDRRARRIVLPWPFAVVLAVGTILPRSLARVILARA